MKDLRVGVVGLGRLGYTHAVNLAHNVPRVVLAAVGDVDENRRHEVSARLGCAAYADTEEMLGEAALDAVVVATPSAYHAEPVLQVVGAGLPLFCEKPLASTLADNERLAAAIREAGVECQIGFNRRFDPEYVEARERIAAGDIGRPVYCYSITRDPFPPPAWACDPARGGGLFIDMQLHDYDVTRFLLGSEPVRIHAEESALVVDGGGVDRFADNVTTSLRFAGGELALLHASMHAAYGYDVYTEVYGERGSIRIGGPEKSRLQVASGGAGLCRPQTYLGDEGLPHFIRRFERSYMGELAAFCSAVLDGGASPVTADDAVAAFRVATRAIESAGSGRALDI